MKKNFFLNCFLVILLGFFVLSCNKNCYELPHDDSKEYSLNYRVVRFNTIEEYEKFVEESDEKIQEQLFSRMQANGFKNYFSNPKHLQEFVKNEDGSESTELLMDGFLGRLLNEHGIINIGKYLYRVDKSTERVYALRYNKEDDYSKAVEKLTANRVGNEVLVFSTEDDVLDEIIGIENGENPQTRKSCDGAADFDRFSPAYYSPLLGKIQYRARYVKNGIHFVVRIGVSQAINLQKQFEDRALKFEIKPDVNNWKAMRMRRKPCNKVHSTTHAGGDRYFNTDWIYSGNYRDKIWKPYEGVRALNGYRVLLRGYVDGAVLTAQDNYEGWFGREMNSNF